MLGPHRLQDPDALAQLAETNSSCLPPSPIVGNPYAYSCSPVTPPFMVSLKITGGCAAAPQSVASKPVLGIQPVAGEKGWCPGRDHFPFPRLHPFPPPAGACLLACCQLVPVDQAQSL